MLRHKAFQIIMMFFLQMRAFRPHPAGKLRTLSDNTFRPPHRVPECCDFRVTAAFSARIAEVGRSVRVDGVDVAGSGHRFLDRGQVMAGAARGVSVRSRRAGEHA